MEQDEFAAWYQENERRARAVDMLEQVQQLVTDAAALYQAADGRLRAYLECVKQERQRPRERHLDALVLEVNGARAVLVRAFQLRRVLKEQVRHLLSTRDEQLHESSNENEEDDDDALSASEWAGEQSGQLEEKPSLPESVVSIESDGPSRPMGMLLGLLLAVVVAALGVIVGYCGL
ncbi:hypothetical protein ATCC90586_011862 [Pythium insidiosum]|nr:hypothetical protein ATCC90586_011862 [Pythium insidiosum]